MTFTEEQQALREAVRDLLGDRCTPAHVRAVMESDSGADLDLYRALARMGVTDLPGLVEVGVALEECGKALVPAPIVTVAGIAQAALDGAGADPALVAATRAGDAIPVLAASPPDGGVLRLIPDAHVATHVLWVEDDRLFAAAREDCEVTVLPTMDATRRLCEVRVAQAERSDIGDGRAGMDAARLHGAVALAHELVGIAQACLNMAVAHAKTREQFGKPIGTYQAVSHRCVDMFIATEAARSHAYFAAWAVQEDVDEAALAAAQAKAAAGDAAIFAAQGAIQVHGGIGMTWEHDLHLYLKRAHSSAALLGRPSVHRRRIADLMGV